MKSSNVKLKVYFDTLGCAKNICDTEHMSSILSQSRYCVVDEPMHSDVIVINTCSFIQSAAQESIDTIFEYLKFYNSKEFIVVGCLPSRYGTDLQESLTEVKYFIPCNKEDSIVAVLDSIWNDKLASGYVSYHDDKGSDTGSKKNTNSYSYVKIGEGCNRFCSYCTIPYIRGRYYSIDFDSILKECISKKNQGVKEIVLVAQDCGAWGSDLDNNQDLAWLLDSLSDKLPEILFRPLYIQPDAVSDNLIDVISNKNNIANYFDIPMQHCNSNVLKAMNRAGNKDKYLNLIKKIRTKIPDCTIRTTLIVGFPGEDDHKFEELLDFVGKAKFDYCGVFKYSQEDGTKAAKLKEQVDEDIKDDRLNLVTDAINSISLNKLESRLGSVENIIVEGTEEGRLYGRAYFQAPDVDGVIFLQWKKAQNVKIGDIVKVKIVDTEMYDFIGEIVNNV